MLPQSAAPVFQRFRRNRVDLKSHKMRLANKYKFRAFLRLLVTNLPRQLGKLLNGSAEFARQPKAQDWIKADDIALFGGQINPSGCCSMIISCTSLRVNQRQSSSSDSSIMMSSLTASQ